MYIKQRGVPRWSTRWVCLQMLSAGCLVVSPAAAPSTRSRLEVKLIER